MMGLQRERTLILVLLLILAAAAWAMLIRQSRIMTGMGLTMGMGAVFFLVIWVVMMIAMMFPVIAPMILVFARVKLDQTNAGHASVDICLFVGAYLLIWTLFGGLLYLGANAASEVAQQISWITMNAARIGGGILVLAGLYQLTPLKRACLAQCRPAQDFFRHSWREGSSGSFRMGLEHGISCLGCNWLLFVLLFPLGMMNIAAMVLLTALIFAEKCFPQGAHIARFAALALIFYGVLVIVVPTALSLSGAGM